MPSAPRGATRLRAKLYSSQPGDGRASLSNTFAVKMAAVSLIIVTSTIGLRTAIVPRWIAFVGYTLALVMLLTITSFAWIALVFPSWVLLLSAYILVADSRHGNEGMQHEGISTGD